MTTTPTDGKEGWALGDWRVIATEDHGHAKGKTTQALETSRLLDSYRVQVHYKNGTDERSFTTEAGAEAYAEMTLVDADLDHVLSVRIWKETRRTVIRGKRK